MAGLMKMLMAFVLIAVVISEAHGACEDALGMETGDISDSHITASSQYSGNHAAAQGRLNFQADGDKQGAWSAGSNDANQWLQVDLGNTHTKVTGFATQGRNGCCPQWVTVYKLQYSLDGHNFHYYKDHTESEAQFAGNTDSDTVVHHILAEGAIKARYIRFRPTAWHVHISMRVELYGCEACEDVLGMETGDISDSQITASSQYSGNHAAAQGRLNFQEDGDKQGAWSAGSSDVNQWLQVDLGNPHTKVTGVATQGRNGCCPQWVTQYKLQYSLDGHNFHYYKDHTESEARFAGNTDSDTVVHHILLEGAIKARYIRFRPTAWHVHISMRVELYGCQVYSDQEFAAAHIPELRFDGGASDNCFPDEATDSNDGQCKNFNSNAPIYYDIRDCGDYRKIVWWIWYGKQKTCDCCSGSHGNDWEHITINFIKDGSVFKQDSVTWFQHDGWYTRSNTEEHPKIYVGKSAHGSYDNWCDGKGASWEQDYCPGGCGYWNDYRNDKNSSPWIPHNIKHISEVTGSVSYRKKDGKDSKIKDEKHFDDTRLNGCIGGDWRCVDGPCGCWRNNHEFGAQQCSSV